MVDLSKHMQRARQAVDRRQYDIAIEVCLECQEIDPGNMENYQLLVDAAKRRAREGGKKGLFGGLGGFSFSKDPQKQLSAAVKKMSKSPDLKGFQAVGDAAMKANGSGPKGMLDLAIFMYEEARATGLFNAQLLWDLAHAYQARFQSTKEMGDIESAIKALAELERGMPSHPEASRTAKSWEALKSMARRAENKSGDYRDQLASDGSARRNEVMNRIIRTPEDAKEVLSFVDKDLEANPKDKSLWQKKGDVHRRVNQFDEAQAAYEKAQEIDPHDFVITMRIGDTKLARSRAELQQAEAEGQDISAGKQRLLELEIAEYRLRQQRQPTELSHSFHLATKLMAAGEIDEAASNFQKSVGDPRYKKQSHFHLGTCFAKKKLLDLAVQQYTSCLSLIEDDLGDEAKDVRYHRARVYEAQGKVNEAETDYTRLVELDLGYKDAAQRLSALRSN
ncbi:MAG: tetratricopeptide repeat protein [Planctomycetota bacterium]|nr:MAG: tetratricopeptide repeat protein [Planctomycetota bacterium]